MCYTYILYICIHPLTKRLWMFFLSTSVLYHWSPTFFFRLLLYYSGRYLTRQSTEPTIVALYIQSYTRNRIEKTAKREKKDNVAKNIIIWKIVHLFFCYFFVWCGVLKRQRERLRNRLAVIISYVLRAVSLSHSCLMQRMRISSFSSLDSLFPILYVNKNAFLLLLFRVPKNSIAQVTPSLRDGISALSITPSIHLDREFLAQAFWHVFHFSLVFSITRK